MIVCLPRLQKHWLLLLLCCGGVGGSAWAESGSAQTTMALVVPPSEANIAGAAAVATAGSGSRSEYAFYETDTNVTVIEKGEQVTYQVWISI